MAAGARNSDPITSHEAAESINTTELEALVLAAVVEAGERGATQDDLVRLMPGWGVQTITPRVYPLLTKGKVFDLGEKRIGHSRRRQRVVVAERFVEPWLREVFRWKPDTPRSELVAAMHKIIHTADTGGDIDAAIDEARHLLGEFQ